MTPYHAGAGTLCASKRIGDPTLTDPDANERSNLRRPSRLAAPAIATHTAKATVDVLLQ